MAKKKSSGSGRNKKIANAQSTPAFRSKLEKKIYDELIALGIQPKYESERIILMEGFYPSKQFYIDSMEHKEKVRSITYTPDYKILVNGYTVYIEAKGWPNDRYPMKKKLFLKYLEAHPECVFAEVHSIIGLRNTLRKINELDEYGKEKTI
jgi:hypothetical protein